ncbi:glycosyltransferase [Faecalibacterium sp. HTF-128]|uniref:Glycosyltransferase n=1 Tax=Faecalibacterium wellingii TaxID=2929491 RepID=A0AB35Y5Q5_9FIRM
MKKILYVGQIAIEGSASCTHVRNRARFFNNIGYEVYGLSECPKNECDKVEDTDFLKYIYMKPFHGKGKVRGAGWIADQFLGIHTYNEIIRALKFISPDIIILYELNSIVVEERIRAYCERHNIRLIIEVTEWMEVENRKEIATRGIVWQKDIQKRYIDKRCGNIIAISEFLYEHYRNQGCNVIRLPPLVYDFADKDQVFRDRDAVKLRQVKLVFAGTTDFKDYLEPMLKAIRKINNNEIKIIFDVVGPSPDAIESMLECSSPTQYGINCYGHLSHENTLSIVRKADFSVLMRENKRYAKAGVSTKFVEAMSLAVPSICTAVGGTDAFVTDGVDGVLIKDNSVHEVLDKLVQITNMDSSKILQMKLNALKTAKQVFSEGQYYNVAKCFLEGEGFDSQNKEEAKL